MKDPAQKSVPARHEIPESDKWNISSLYASNRAWEDALQQLEAEYPGYSRFKGTLGESSGHLLSCLEFDKKIDLQIERLNHYSSLQTAEDSSDDGHLDRSARLQNLLTKVSEATSYITPEILSIDGAKLQSFLNSPELAAWKWHLEKMARMKAHTLSEKEERIMAVLSSPLEAADETFSQLTNVDMKFGFIADELGCETELSQSSFSSFLVKQDHGLRKKAFHQFYEQFECHQYTLASTLAYSVKTDCLEAQLRNFPSARARSLYADNIPEAVYDSLVDAVKSSLDPLFRYYRLRRKTLGLDALHFYDTYVPLVKDFKQTTAYEDAVRMVCDSLKPLGEEYVSALREGLTSARWCDRYESKGKRSGAFSSSSYGNPPYILMNFKEDVFSDIYTLAHEAGHSMHTWFSQREQSFQDYHYPIFLAEVASTFNEELLTHHLLANTDDPKMKAYLLNRQIDDIRGTVYRQTMFAEFEKIIHQTEEKGESLTLQKFKSIYRQLLESYHGEGLVIDPQLELECLRIPHFYSAFYVYKYATGLSAAVALSQRVIGGGKVELDAYLGFLRSGGSRHPIDTLQSAGVDMASPEPIRATLELFSKRVGELENILSEIS